MRGANRWLLFWQSQAVLCTGQELLTARRIWPATPDVSQLMLHWYAVCRALVLRVHHECVIPEGSARMSISAAGFRPALRGVFHKTSLIFVTASSEQVLQPIYSWVDHGGTMSLGSGVGGGAGDALTAIEISQSHSRGGVGSPSDVDLVAPSDGSTRT